jgi:hypothetical protein
MTSISTRLTELLGRAGALLICQVQTLQQVRAAAAVIAGEVVDLMTDIPSAAEIVQRMTTSATRLLAGASNKYRIIESQ